MLRWLFPSVCLSPKDPDHNRALRNQTKHSVTSVVVVDRPCFHMDLGQPIKPSSGAPRCTLGPFRAPRCKLGCKQTVYRARFLSAGAKRPPDWPLSVAQTTSQTRGVFFLNRSVHDHVLQKRLGFFFKDGGTKSGSQPTERKHRSTFPTWNLTLLGWNTEAEHWTLCIPKRHDCDHRLITFKCTVGPVMFTTVGCALSWVLTQTNRVY